MTTRGVLLTSAVVTASLLVGMLAAPAAGRNGDAAHDADLLSRLEPRTRVGRHAQTGRLTYLGGTAARPVATGASLGHPGSARGASRAFLARFGRAFGVAHAARELDVAQVSRVGRGRTFVRYRQTYRGLPVIAGQLIVQTDRDGDVLSVSGEASPGISVGIRPAISAGRARRLAIAATALQAGVNGGTLQPTRPYLAIYDPRLAGDPRAVPVARLVWRVDVRSERREIDEFVAVDAQRGSIAAAFNQTPHADPPANAIQRVCDANNVRASSGEGTDSDPLHCDPGDPLLVASPGSSAVADVLDAHNGAEATYDFFARRFGRNSLDGVGMTLISSVRFCFEFIDSCPYADMFWNGIQMYYGDGFAAADDLVAHELTHGLTEQTSGLLYFFQSGAINEAMSDIFGEMIDQTNGLGDDRDFQKWRIGEDVPGFPGAWRDMEDPTTFNHPDRMGSPYYDVDTFADNGGVHSNSGVANKAAFLITDGATFNGQTVSGLGIDRSAAIWYRVNRYLLSPGSDYYDLANALHQACVDLMGTAPLDAAGAPGAEGAITAASCTEVDDAIAATEMRSEPPVAKVKHANLCGSGKTPTVTPFFDPITASATGWTTNAPTFWVVLDDYYATSAPYSLAYLDGEGTAANRWSRSKRMTLPGSGPIYLAFRHYIRVYKPSDGGIVQYTTNANGTSGWTDLPPGKFTFNGYNDTISGPGNPLNGKQSFSGFSYGWALSKADLTFLKGKRIYIRFLFGESNVTPFLDGWWIDDVRVYKCVAHDGTGPTVGTPKLDLAKGQTETDGTPILVKVIWSASDLSGIAATFLHRMVAGGDFQNVHLPGLKPTSVTTSAPDSALEQTFRAGARDNVGNRRTNETTGKIRAVQETGGTLVYTGAWTSEAASGYYGGGVRFAEVAGRKARVKVPAATDLGWVTTRGPDRGKADVYIDGVKKATIDLYSAAQKNRQVVYVFAFGSAGSHTIEVRVLGTKNAASSDTRVDIDAFEAIGN